MPKVSLPRTPEVVAAQAILMESLGVGTGTAHGNLAALTGGLISVSPRANPAAGIGANFTTARAVPNGATAPELAGSDFIILNEPKQRTVGIVYAIDGDGKTHYAINYTPEPVILFGLDRRGEREIKKSLNRGRKIYYIDAATPANIAQMSDVEARAAGKASLDLITKNYEWAIAKSMEWGQGTMVFDTSSELRDIVRVAIRGRIDRPNPKTGERGDFGASDAIINRTLKYFCDRARDSKLNLILLSRSKPIYDGREDTGRKTWDTDKIFVQAADWIIEYRMVGVAGLMTGIQVLGAPAPTGPSWEIQATKPKLAPEETGKIYRQAEWEADGSGPFAYGCVRMVPGSKVGDWK